MTYFLNKKQQLRWKKQTKNPPNDQILCLASQRTKVVTNVAKLIYEDELMDLLTLVFPHRGNICLQLDIFPLSKLLVWQLSK